MTTDTALALLAEAEDAICILSDSIRDRTVSEYYSNLRDRITALLDSGRWISVKDGLPLVGMSVLVSEPNRPVEKTCHDGRDWVLPHKSKVTHWMPLPPLPKGDMK